jgi:hypothetical protein
MGKGTEKGRKWHLDLDSQGENLKLFQRKVYIHPNDFAPVHNGVIWLEIP